MVGAEARRTRTEYTSWFLVMRDMLLLSGLHSPHCSLMQTWMDKPLAGSHCHWAGRRMGKNMCMNVQGAWRSTHCL